MMLRFLPVVPILALAVACSVDTNGPYHLDYPPGPDGDTNASPPVDGTTTQLVRAVVDSDQRMSNVVGGEGVGVFIEYDRGGYWHVRWTCDTARERRPCTYVVNLSASSITEVQTEGGATVDTSGNRFVNLKTQTQYEVHGVNFRSPAGDVLTVEVEVDGLKTGAYVFFVQDGKVNGGYEGRLSNPIELVGTDP